MSSAALVWVPAVIFLALDGQTGAAIGVGLWCAVIVDTADNVLRPILIGKDTEMPDLLVMLTTLGGLALFGAAGIVIGPLIGARSPVHARDAQLPQRTKELRPESEPLGFLVTPTMRSWNQFSAFVEDWDELRMAA